MNLTQRESCPGRSYPEPVKRQASKGQRFNDSTIQRFNDSTIQRFTNPAFTLLELLVVMGIIGILAAIVLTATNKAKQKASAINCLSNMKQIGLASRMYVDDYNGYYVPYGTGTKSNPGALWSDSH